MSIWGVRETYLRHTIFSSLVRRRPRTDSVSTNKESITMSSVNGERKAEVDQPLLSSKSSEERKVSPPKGALLEPEHPASMRAPKESRLSLNNVKAEDGASSMQSRI